MAKVTGPLFSVEASGKVSDALVYFPWKGRHVVREWLKPANPKFPDQGDIRLILGALGRGCSPIHKTSVVAADVRLYMATGNTWVAEIVQYMIKNVVNDGTAWDALFTELEALTDLKTALVAKATELNIHAFDVDYKGCTNAAAGALILYCMAKCFTNWELLGTKGFQRAPYTTALASWTSSEVDAMCAEFVAT